MQVILINAASRREEFDFDTIDKAHGDVGSFGTIILDGRVGHFKYKAVDSTETVFVDETPDDFAQFTYAHLPAHLQAVSKRFYDLAEWTVLTIKPGHQRNVGLLDLLRSKDAIVRAALAR
jgi:hypothetical protein